MLDITDCYSDTVSGGVKTYLHAKMEAFAERDVDHVVVVPGERHRMETRADSRLYRLAGPVVPVSKAYRVMWSPAALREVIWRERPDVIEVGSPFIVPWLVHRATRGVPVKLVGFYHADIVRTFAEPYVPHAVAAPLRVMARMAARRLIRSVYRGFDVTVASSASVADELRRLGVPRVREVSLGVDLGTFRPRPEGGPADRADLGVDKGVPLGVYAGRFCAEKRLDVVLEAHGALPPAARPHLLLVGGGPHRERLERLARERERLTLHPYVDGREALARIYAAADFYVAPGPGETFGLSIAEAMACGLPVLVVDRGAAPDRVDGSGCGFRYVHGDAASARDALETVRDAVLSRSEALRRAARDHAERTYDWSRSFDALLHLYRELVDAPAAAGGR